MSDDETYNFIDLGRGAASIPIVGPVSPNRNLQIVDYSPLVSSSITSLDGSQDYSSDLDMAVAQEIVAAADIAQSLRTVPATTDLTTRRSNHAALREYIRRSYRLLSRRTPGNYLLRLRDPLARDQGRRHRNRSRSVHFEEDDDEAEQVPPPNPVAEVMRRGNSTSDCSQCSSADEDDANATPIIPSQLVEWSYPGPNH